MNHTPTHNFALAADHQHAHRVARELVANLARAHTARDSYSHRVDAMLLAADALLAALPFHADLAMGYHFDEAAFARAIQHGNGETVTVDATAMFFASGYHDIPTTFHAFDMTIGTDERLATIDCTCTLRRLVPWGGHMAAIYHVQRHAENHKAGAAR